MRFLREGIRLTQRAKADTKKEAESTAQNIADKAAEILDKVGPLSSESLIPPKTVNSASLKNCCKSKQSSVSPTSFVNKTNWVINLSSRPLNEAEVSFLKNGMNFAVTPANVPATEIIAKVESAVRPLDAERTDTVRRAVNTILEQAPGACFSKLPVITGPVKLFCFPFQTGLSKVLKIIQ